MSLIKNFFFSLLSLIIIFILLELSIRVLTFSLTFNKVQSLVNYSKYSWPFSSEGWALRGYLNKTDFDSSESLYEFHPTRGWTGKKNLSKWYYGYFYSTNSFGFRGDSLPDPLLDNIMLLGSSQIYGEEVDDRFVISEVLSNRINNHNFLNFGVGGYGLDQMYVTFMEEFEKWNPKHVVFSVVADDLIRMNFNYRDAAKPFFEIGNDKKNFDNFDLKFYPPDNDVYQKHISSRWYGNQFKTLNIIDNIIDKYKLSSILTPLNSIRAKKLMSSVLDKNNNKANIYFILLTHISDDNKTPQYKLFREICDEFSDKGLICNDTLSIRANTKGLRQGMHHYYRLGNKLAADIIESSLKLDVKLSN